MMLSGVAADWRANSFAYVLILPAALLVLSVVVYPVVFCRRVQLLQLGDLLEGRLCRSRQLRRTVLGKHLPQRRRLADLCRRLDRPRRRRGARARPPPQRQGHAPDDVPDRDLHSVGDVTDRLGPRLALARQSGLRPDRLRAPGDRGAAHRSPRRPQPRHGGPHLHQCVALGRLLDDCHPLRASDDPRVGDPLGADRRRERVAHLPLDHLPAAPAEHLRLRHHLDVQLLQHHHDSADPHGRRAAGRDRAHHAPHVPGGLLLLQCRLRLGGDDADPRAQHRPDLSLPEASGAEGVLQ